MRYSKIFTIVLCTFIQISYSQNSVNVDSLEDKLIILALKNNATLKVDELKVKSANKDVSLAKAAWGDLIVGQYNVNEANINPSSTNGMNIYYPKYLIGLRVSLSTFFELPLKTQRAKIQQQITEKELGGQKNFIVNEVKRRLRIYVAKRENFILRKQLVDEAKSHLNVVAKKYNGKEIEFNEYLVSSNNYLTLKETLNTTESEMYIAKYDLEEIVGMELELFK